MLVVRAVEGRTHSLGQFVGREQSVGFHHSALAVHPLGLYRVQPRALGRQQAAYDPYPLFLLCFTWRLCSSIHRRTSWLMCQLALSQTNTHTLLPIALSFWEHQSRNRVVMPLTGRPSTKRSHVSSNSGK